MIKVTVQYTLDKEMIEAHCTADEIRGLNSKYKVKVIDKDGKEDKK